MLKKQLSIFLIIAVLMVLLCSTSIVQAFEPSGYPITTIQEMFNQAQSMAKDLHIKESDVYMSPKPIPFAVKAKFLSKERFLSEKNYQYVDYYGTAQKVNALAEYIHEILINDSDGREYWLPIPEHLLESLRREYYSDCSLTLYLHWILKAGKDPFAIIDEFAVEANEMYFLQKGPRFDIKTFKESPVGICWNIPKGKDIKAVQDGKISRYSRNPFNPTNLGVFVEMEHKKDFMANEQIKTITYYTIYGFLSMVTIDSGGIIPKGTIIGKSGDSGPLAHKELNGEFFFAIYSTENEPFLATWTNSEPIKQFGVYWYDPTAIFR
jgi:hypothetical protein